MTTPFLRRPGLLAATLLLAGLATGPAAAESKAVKCGRVYQDRPCAGQEGRLVARTQEQKAVATRRTVDAACQRRGADAQKIISQRQEGSTEDDQLAGTRSVAEKRLISEVYRQEGDAAQQRSAVEQNCMAERLRLAKGQRPTTTASK
ncbi:hypothetical protein [Ideonella sp. BN130291]|uniref:hypothetical protein n=1 Tax=Ideonella sp. BN130291 TaxID=3112940 RepID=UPI002E2598AD|nr:hypothetical protein [Ideonella sp. BN130291]